MNKPKEQLVIIGAGGHAKVCYDIAVEMNQWDNIIILDDNVKNDFFKISGSLNEYSKYRTADFFVAIGDNGIRERLLNELYNNNKSITTLIHPKAIISPSATIDIGTVIMPGVVINANTKIGRGCILNTSSTIDHDNFILEYVHISPGVNIAGGVKIGVGTWIGIGSTILNNIEITSKVTVGAGSLVINTLDESGTYIGSPCMKLIK